MGAVPYPRQESRHREGRCYSKLKSLLSSSKVFNDEDDRQKGNHTDGWLLAVTYCKASIVVEDV